MDDRTACIILNMISGIGHARLKALLSRFNTPSEILKQDVESLSSVKGIGQALAEQVAGWKDNVDFEAEMELVKRGGVRIITIVDDDYPVALKEIYDPPICLYVRGTLPDFQSDTIAVVGSRRVTNYGRKMARHLTEAAAYAGWTVISGLAYGVDAIAHQACLDAKGITVGVLGGGLARIHPQDHIPLARSIIENNGALISEYPMNFPVSRQSFPRRNRIVSGLSRAILVIEAGLDSGALITANTALEQGRSVFAVPGQADNPQGKGCNKLIRQGAKLTEEFEDILEDFEFLPGFAALREDSAVYPDDTEEISMPAGLSEQERQVIETLSADAMSLDAVASGTGIPAGNLMAIMMKLEMKQLISQSPGKIYSLK